MTVLQQLRQQNQTGFPTSKSIAVQTKFRVENKEQIDLRDEVLREQARINSLDISLYPQEYANLRPEVKKFFPSPESVMNQPDVQEYVTKKTDYDVKVLQYNDYKKGFDLGISGDSGAIFGVPETEHGRMGWQDGLAALNYTEQQAKLREMGIKPVYTNGELVGFEDSTLQMSYSPEYIANYRPELEGTIFTIKQPENVVYDDKGFGYTIKKDLYNIDNLKQDGDINIWDWRDRSNYPPSNNTLEVYEAYKKSSENTKEFFRPFYDTGSSIVKGAVKSTPTYDNLKKAYEKELRFKDVFTYPYQNLVPRNIKDPDVQAFLGATALGASFTNPYTAPLGWIAVTGFAGKKGYDLIKEPSYYHAGEFTMASLPFIPKGMKVIKNVYKKTGAKYIPPEEVFSKDVLKEGQKFPSSSGTKEIVYKFEKAKEGDLYKGQHSTTNVFDPITKIGKSTRIEDSGLYVTPKGEGSPHFLKIVKKADKYEYTLNPLKEIGNNPNVVELSFSDLQRLPPEVLIKANKIVNTKGRKEGYKFINEWYKKNAVENTAYVPLRSERFETRETQAVIPEGTSIYRNIEGNIIQKVKGYDRYTIYEGEVVPIRDYMIKGKNKISKSEFNKIKNELKKYELDNYYYNKYSSKRYVTPYRSLSGGSYRKSSSPSKYIPTPNYRYTPPGSLGYVYIPQYDYNMYYPPNPPGQFDWGLMTDFKFEKERNYKTRNRGSDNRKLMKGYQPILLTKDGKRLPLKIYPNKKEAFAEGVITVDETPINKFLIKRVTVEPDDLSRGRDTKAGRKFKRRGGVFIEKTPYRRDKPMERGRSYRHNSHLL